MPQSASPGRQLIHVPVIHGPQDLGSQFEAVKAAYVARFGFRAWRQHLAGIDQFWIGVRQRVLALRGRDLRLRLYQDGMPVCGRELELARQLAAQGSQNHRLVVELVERGAVLEGTEDPELLRQEQERSCRAGNLAEPAPTARYDDLMARRDAYVAGRIDATLQHRGEMGLLFMGALHRVTEKLPPDIRVVRL